MIYIATTRLRGLVRLSMDKNAVFDIVAISLRRRDFPCSWSNGLLYAKGYVSPRFRISESIESRMFTAGVGDAAQLLIYFTFLRSSFLKPAAKLVRAKVYYTALREDFLPFQLLARAPYRS